MAYPNRRNTTRRMAGRPLPLLLSIAALSLAGCGGGGGARPAPTPVPPSAPAITACTATDRPACSDKAARVTALGPAFAPRLQHPLPEQIAIGKDLQIGLQRLALFHSKLFHGDFQQLAAERPCVLLGLLAMAQ